MFKPLLPIFLITAGNPNPTAAPTTSGPTAAPTTAPPSGSCDGVPSTGWSCCDVTSPCDVGGGDCDFDSHCSGNLICGSNNCLTDYSSSGSDWSSAADCCTCK